MGSGLIKRGGSPEASAKEEQARAGGAANRGLVIVSQREEQLMRAEVARLIILYHGLLYN